MNTQLLHGDCLERLKELPDNSVDSVVTDPPYGLSFMGKKWDYDVPSEDIWRECLRVLKPGGHLLAFAGTRTQHRMAVRIEDAGFEIRDMIAWVYGSGFPKSHDVSKAVWAHEIAGGSSPKKRRMATMGEGYSLGETAGRIGVEQSMERVRADAMPVDPEKLTDAARQWQGWGTALKPALEPVTVARKPFNGTVAANVLAHGTGGLNVDGCRVGIDSSERSVIDTRSGAGFGTIQCKHAGRETGERFKSHAQGRWPANLIHDGSDEVVGLFPGEDSGSAARFFYVAKASKRDRDEGCEGLALVTHQSGMGGAMPVDDAGNSRDRFKAQSRNHHPTVKPTDLMRYLCRLVTPPGGTVLDPFMGSGSTGKAAMLEGFQFIGIEREAEYLEIAKARIEHAKNQQSEILV